MPDQLWGLSSGSGESLLLEDTHSSILCIAMCMLCITMQCSSLYTF